jgi:hypothetical protein
MSKNKIISESIDKMKLCPECNIEKEEASFMQGKRKIVRCLPCQNLFRKAAREKKKKEAPHIMKICSLCHTEKNGADFEIGTLHCKECLQKRNRALKRPSEDDPDKTCKDCGETKVATMFRKKEFICKECNKKKTYAWREKNKERFLAICKTYRDTQEAKGIRNAYLRKRYADNIKDRLLQLYRTRIRDLVKKPYFPKKTSFNYNEFLGCEWEFLIAWLEFNMTEEMSWENYGTYWHIDHVYPCSLFDFSNEEDRRKCFNWTNLTPLEAIENIKKSNKLDTQIIQHYRTRAIEFIQQHSTISFVTESLPDDIRLLVISGALTTKDAVKAVSGSEERSEV